MKKENSLIERIRANISKLQAEIDERRIKIEALKACISSDSMPATSDVIDEKPKGFHLSKALREVMGNHVGEWVFVDDAVKEIYQRWGYSPIRRTVQVTLNAWSKNTEKTKIEKDQNKIDYYRYI